MLLEVNRRVFCRKRINYTLTTNNQLIDSQEIICTNYISKFERKSKGSPILMYKIYYIYMYKIYMCVSYDLKVSNEDFCCWGKNSSDIFKQWKSFPCSRLAYPDINTSG